MADFNSQLPVRTENAGDVIVKIADATVPNQQLKVETDGSINVNASFTTASIQITDGTDTLAINNDGSINSVVSATNLDIRDLAFATDKVDVSGSEVSLDSATLAALENITVSATNLDVRDLTFATDKVDVSGSSVTVTAADLDIRDLNSATDSVTVVASNLDVRDLTHASDSVKVGDGTDFLAVNSDGSINVNIVDASPGTAINDYNTASAVAGGAASNHDYTSTGNFYLNQIHASGSGKMKIEVLVNAVSKFVFFNSTANPNMDITLANPILATTGQVVRIIRTNKDNQSQDLYSTISGYNA